MNSLPIQFRGPALNAMKEKGFFPSTVSNLLGSKLLGLGKFSESLSNP